MVEQYNQNLDAGPRPPGLYYSSFPEGMTGIFGACYFLPLSSYPWHTMSLCSPRADGRWSRSFWNGGGGGAAILGLAGRRTGYGGNRCPLTSPQAGPRVSLSWGIRGSREAALTPPFCPACPPGAEAARLPSPLPTLEEPPILCRHLDAAEQPLPALPRSPAPGRLPAGPLPRSLYHPHLQAAVRRGRLLPPARKYVDSALLPSAPLLGAWVLPSCLRFLGSLHVFCVRPLPSAN